MAGDFQGNCGLGGILGGAVVLTGCAVLFAAAFPVIQITFGAVYMHQCPAAPVIPVYLMVSGIWALIIMVLFALLKLCPAAPGHTMWTVWVSTLLLFIFIWFLFGSYQIYSTYPPNYDKNVTASNSSNRSIHASPEAPRGLLFTLENQSALKKSRMISNKQTWIKTALGSKRNRERLNIQQEEQTEATVPYCSRAVYMFAFWTTTLVYVSAGNVLLMTTCLYGFMKCIDACVKHLST